MWQEHQWHTRLSPHVPFYCCYHILTSSVIYYWTDAWQHGIYLLTGGPRLSIPRIVWWIPWPQWLFNCKRKQVLLSKNYSSLKYSWLLLTHQTAYTCKVINIVQWAHDGASYSLCTINILNKKICLAVGESCLVLSFCSCQCCLPLNLHLLKFKVSAKLCARVEILCHVLKRNMVIKRFKFKRMSALKHMATLLIWIQCHWRDDNDHYYC